MDMYLEQWMDQYWVPSLGVVEDVIDSLLLGAKEDELNG